MAKTVTIIRPSRKKAVTRSRKTAAKRSVTRISQVTKRKPTKRLVSRRKSNSKPGYFPNPSTKVATFRTMLARELANVLDAIRGRKPNAQALLSRYQGYLDAGRKLGVLTATDANDFLKPVKSSLKMQIRRS